MKCREIQFELHEFADRELSVERSTLIDHHLDSCPLCRVELDSIRNVRQYLGSLRPIDISPSSLNTLRAKLASELTPNYGYPAFKLIEVRENWMNGWMWPTTIGTVTSLVFGVFLLSVIMLPSDVPQLTISTESPEYADDSLFLARGDQVITPQEFANSRSDISFVSPSLNPASTLISAAESESLDDEVVFVAEVYGNGRAEVTDVVEKGTDRRMMDRLMAAFRPDRSTPPFVPARLDNREDMVRIVLKFQNVNVTISDADSLR